MNLNFGLIVAVVLLGLGMLGGGYLWGSTSASGDCDIEAAEARGRAAERFAQRMQTATDASLAISGVTLELNTTMHVTRTRTRTIAEEVSRDVDATPDLAGCPLPARTRELRSEQVLESRRLSGAEGRPVQR